MPTKNTLIPNPIASKAASIAHLALNTPYVSGGTQFGKGVDCSGLCWRAYSMAGYKGGRFTTYTIFAQDLIHVPRNQEIPGDFIFSYPDENGIPGPGHMVMSLGNGKVIAADHTGSLVRIEDAGIFTNDASIYVGSRRLYPAVGQSPAGSPNPQTNQSGSSTSALGSVESGLHAIVNPTTWLRAGEILLGIIALIAGILILGRKPIGGAAKSAGKIAEVAALA